MCSSCGKEVGEDGTVGGRWDTDHRDFLFEVVHAVLVLLFGGERSRGLRHGWGRAGRNRVRMRSVADDGTDGE